MSEVDQISLHHRGVYHNQQRETSNKQVPSSGVSANSLKEPVARVSKRSRWKNRPAAPACEQAEFQKPQTPVFTKWRDMLDLPILGSLQADAEVPALQPS